MASIPINISNAVSVLRVTAMLSIVICHILQVYNNKWAWVFNIGVQVFLFLSGYLYGNKEIKDWYGWYKKRFFKLYIPYIILVGISLLSYHFLTETEVSIRSVLAYTTVTQGIGGG